jgi:hypothetical protein
MFLLFWAAKGGSGTPVVAAATALALGRCAPTVLVDLGGDACAALGVPEGAGAGVLDWLVAPGSSPAELFALAVTAADELVVVHAGTDRGDPLSAADWDRIADACAGHRGTVVVDAGRHVPPERVHEVAAQSLLVTRPCFLALRRAAAHHGVGAGVVVVDEPGRALRRSDIERALGLPVRAVVPWDPAIARAVDAGLLASRLPGPLARELRRLVAELRA